MKNPGACRSSRAGTAPVSPVDSGEPGLSVETHDPGGFCPLGGRKSPWIMKWADGEARWGRGVRGGDPGAHPPPALRIPRGPMSAHVENRRAAPTQGQTDATRGRPRAREVPGPRPPVRPNTGKSGARCRCRLAVWSHDRRRTVASCRVAPDADTAGSCSSRPRCRAPTGRWPSGWWSLLAAARPAARRFLHRHRRAGRRRSSTMAASRFR